jgi:SAM-dependent methyltransferase
LSAFLKKIVLKREAADCISQKPPPGSVLELGCAEGVFLEVLKSRGYHVEGVEFDSGVAARAKQAGLKIFSGTLIEAKLPSASFDMVYSKHVIEHLPDVREVLKDIYRILKPDGVLLVATPNIECPLVRFFQEDSLDLDLPRHLNLWSCDGLRKQIEGAGFEVLRISHDPVPNSWVRSLRLRFEKHPWARRFLVLENPLALLLFAPLSVVLALAGKSSRIRLWAKKKTE